MIFVRNTGKLCFATLREGDGTELQAMLSLDRVGAERAGGAGRPTSTWATTSFVDGEVITSRRGELSVLADRWRWPPRRCGRCRSRTSRLTEEARVRQRYVDLIVRPAGPARWCAPGPRWCARCATRCTAAASSRSRRRCCSCCTAARRPGRSSPTVNALDTDLYLRIAPELFLKRAVVGGIERVFEINRNFRNEGVDSTHSPEFAMLEAYEAYGDYDTMAELTRELVQEAARRARAARRRS